jgi:hypothetical protein
MSAEQTAVPAKDTVISAQEATEDSGEDRVEGSGEESLDPRGPGRCTLCSSCTKFVGGTCTRAGCGHRYSGEHFPTAPGA